MSDDDLWTLRAGPDEHLTPAGKKILNVAARLFYWEGIRAVGMEAISSEAGVTKKTVYDCFGSKDALVVAYLRDRDVRWRRRLLACLDEVPRHDPEQQLLATFDALESWMSDENPRGCGFVNAYAELADPSHPGRQVIVDQKTWLLRLLAELCGRAHQHSADSLAARLMALHEGATVLNSLNLIPGVARSVRDLAAEMLERDTVA